MRIKSIIFLFLIPKLVENNKKEIKNRKKTIKRELIKENMKELKRV